MKKNIYLLILLVLAGLGKLYAQCGSTFCSGNYGINAGNTGSKEPARFWYLSKSTVPISNNYRQQS